MPKKNKKLALDSGIQTNQILTNDVEVCIPRLSSIILAVLLYLSDIYCKLRLHQKLNSSFFNWKMDA